MARWILCIAVPGFALAALAACGGGSGDGGSGGGGGSAYTIGGTVSGLTGLGLVLHNGVEDLAVSAAGSFIFSTELATGEPYEVTAKSQPSAPAQNCVVANGSGTVATANVTNVTVSCSAATGYTVSGTVTGLTGSGLILQDNNGDDLAVTGAGPFTFSTGLDAEASYAVTVKAQPSAPAQNCAVTGGSGTVGVANVTGVTVTCTASAGYTVGGTVVGLERSGLVLGLYFGTNPPVSLAVSAAGAFAFPVTFSPGTTYYVAVDGQPAPQICVVSGAGTIGTANVTDVSVECSTPSRFAYAANAGDNTISSYSINPATGALTAIGTPVATGASPFAITGSPDRKHLYVVNQVSSDISVYAIDDTTGVPTPIAGSPFAAGTDPQAMAFAPSGEFLYVANRGSDNLSAYAVDTGSGALTPLSTPTYSTGPGPSAVVVTPSGEFAYVANNGGSNDISAFAIAAGTGELATVAGSPFAVGGNPHSLAYLGSAYPYGNLYTANLDGSTSSISGMAADVRTGQLTRRFGSPFLHRSAKNYIAARGSTLFVATGGGVSEYFTLFSFYLGAAVPAAPGANAYSVTVDPSSPFIYVCNDGTDNVSGYLVGFESLIPIPGSPFPAGHHPDFLAVL